MVTPTPLPTSHEATRNRDGTWNILDVPIFAEIPAKTKGATPIVSREWIEKAVERDKERQAGGFSSPLHVHHHNHRSEGSRKPERAGELRLREVRTARYDGTDLGVVFADFEKVPAPVYERIKQGGLPYRSIEILDPSEVEINSCALLDSEVPFFRFPNLSVSLERPNLRFSAPKRLSKSPVTACVKSGRTRGFLFSAHGVTQMISDADGSENTDSIEVTDTPIPASATEVAIGDPTDKVVEDVAERHFALLETLAEKFAALEAKVDEIAQLPVPDITPESPVTGDELNDTPDTDVEGGVESAPVETFDAGNAALHGRMLALEERLATEDAEKATSARYAAALKTLEGYNLSDNSKATLKTFAATSTEALDTVVQAFLADYPKLPPPTVEDAASGSHASEPAEVAAYSADSNRHARARALAQSFESLKAQGLSCSLAEFIEKNIDVGLVAPSAKE